MAHIRKLIRDNIASTLTGLTTTGANVFQTRVYPISSGSLPGIAIYTKSETSDFITMTRPRIVSRVLTVSIEAYIQGASGYDNLLDTVAKEIEVALCVDQTRGGYAKDTRLINFEAEFSGDPDQPVAYATLTVEVEYVTIEGNPEVAA